LSQLEDLRRRYLAERSGYEVLAKAVRNRLEAEARFRGLLVRFDHRVKDVPSLVKKALVYDLSYQDIPDKAGVRVIYRYAWEGVALEETIAAVFVVLKREDMAGGLEPDQLGYLGVHFDVRFRDDDEGAPDVKLDQPDCEIQVHTEQESVWAGYSHELMYKVPLPTPQNIKRGLYRLMALVELFDREVNHAKEQILSHPDYPVAQVLERLERKYYRLTARAYDHRLSRRVLEALVPLYGDDPETMDQALERFISERGEKIDQLFERYVDDPRAAPLLFQPEAIAIFDRLEQMPTRLEEAFSAVAPRSLLADLAVVWGEPLD
jgi:ppGpp synthetase/RelA/SpoT-type nucleotidyltranferase